MAETHIPNHILSEYTNTKNNTTKVIPPSAIAPSANNRAIRFRKSSLSIFLYSMSSFDILGSTTIPTTFSDISNINI